MDSSTQLDSKSLSAKTLAELRKIAQTFKIPNVTDLKKAELVEAIVHSTEISKAPAAEAASEVKVDSKPVAAEQPAQQVVQTEASTNGANQPTQNRPVTRSVISTTTTSTRSYSENRPDQRFENHDRHDRGGEDVYKNVQGVLEVMKDATHGILRADGVLPGDNDVYISGSQIKKFNLRMGDMVAGPARLPKDKEKYLSLLRVDSVNGRTTIEAAKRPYFSKLTPVFPNRQLKLETTPEIISTRIIDLLSPIGFGQRAMVVAPPKAGKTTLLKDIAHGVSANHPEAKLIVVLVGERPEEVTDMVRSVNGEVYASNFDELPEHNCKVAEMALEKARRMVEWGEDVVILMDSITRLARAYNITMPTSGRTLSGGFDPVALYPPKRFFGAARNFEEGGSLTIVATALVDTGSRMDDLVYEEFKGTGNMELHLDRKLQQRRIFPAIDVRRSSTRNEEMLLDKDVLNQSWRIRRMLEMIGDNEDPTEVLVDRMKKTKSNADFLATLHEV